MRAQPTPMAADRLTPASPARPEARLRKTSKSRLLRAAQTGTPADDVPRLQTAFSSSYNNGTTAPGKLRQGSRQKEVAVTPKRMKRNQLNLIFGSVRGLLVLE